MTRSTLFSPLHLAGLELPNRIVVSPMCQYQADDGCATDWHLMNAGQYAVGAAGLFMFEATHVSRAGRITHRCLGLYSDDNEEALARVVRFCRRHGVARLGIQLAHAGRKASVRPPAQGGTPLPREEDAWDTVAPSALPFAPGWHTPQALDAEGLARVRDQFVEAARRAARIGLDLAELHMAHGYLLHQFLSPLANQRTDTYGGSLENRMRFPLEVARAVRAVWPAGRPLGARITGTDWVEGGITVEEAVALARALRDLGLDFVDVTSGQVDPRQSIPFAPGYNVPFADQVRRQTGMPVMAVGMITQPAQAQAIIAGGQADLVGIARGMMDDPRWAWRAARELGAQTAYAPGYQRAHPSVWKP